MIQFPIMDNTNTGHTGKTLTTAGIMGCLGSLAVVIADALLLGTPRSGYGYFSVSKLVMKEISPERLYAGFALGALLGPLQAAGLWQVYRGLLPAGRKGARAVFWLCMYSWFLGIAVHVGYIFTGKAYQLSALLAGSANSLPAAELSASFEKYLLTLYIPAGFALAAASILFSVLVFRGSSAFPRYAALSSPVFVIPFWFAVAHILPSPAGGYIAPGFINLGWLTFFTATLALNRNRAAN